MRGGFGCSPCCDPCPPCEQECVEPHTGDPFETVYTRFFEGVEAGNPTDGYLTATGDSDTSDPYDGMDGSGPWSQTVGGTFIFAPGVARFPCSVTVSFWRNSYALGPATIPPAGSTLLLNRITVTAVSGKAYAGGNILEEGESIEFNDAIPLVAGSGDQAENDPRTGFGSVTVGPLCANAIVSVQGSLQWDVQKRQHILYGKVRECYGEEFDCPCGVEVEPEELYLTFSNFERIGEEDAISSLIAYYLDGTSYVLDHQTQPWYCGAWTGAAEKRPEDTDEFYATPFSIAYEHGSAYVGQGANRFSFRYIGIADFGGDTGPSAAEVACVAPGFALSGTLSVFNGKTPFAGPVATVDWEIST